MLHKSTLTVMDDNAGQHAHLTGPEELRRLRGILESLETSEEQDRALLAGK